MEFKEVCHIRNSELKIFGKFLFLEQSQFPGTSQLCFCSLVFLTEYIPCSASLQGDTQKQVIKCCSKYSTHRSTSSRVSFFFSWKCLLDVLYDVGLSLQ